MTKGKVLVCKDKGGFKNLTKDQKYPMLKDDGDFFVVNNNAGIASKYAKKYFREAELTIDDLANLVFEWDGDTEYSFDLDGFDDEDNTEIVDLVFDEVAGNCGSTSIEGINSLYEAILNMYTNHYNNQAVIVGAIVEKVKQGVEAIIRDIIRNVGDNTGFVVFSTNNIHPPIWEILDGITDEEDRGVRTEEKRSNHWTADNNRMMKIWIIYNR